KPEGLLNQLLLGIGVIQEPLIITNTYAAVFIGIVYSYLPFMVLPLYSSLEKMDHSLIEAAQDLGCQPIAAFWKITFPLSLPGIVAGCLLVFIPAVGEFVIPDLLGSSRTLMIGKTLWTEFFTNRDWPVSSAVAIILLLVLIVPIVFFQNAQARAQEAGRSGGELDLEPLHHHRSHARRRFSPSAGRASGHLFLPRLEAGHRIGRLVDQMVRIAVPHPGPDGRAPGDDPPRRDFGLGRHGARHAGGSGG